MSIDLIVFGPHPDDLEIGLGGTIARHTAAGHSVGLCDLTRGELGSNGTPDERLAEAARASEVLGAAWRENLGWPDGGIVPTPELLDSAVALIRRHRPRAIAVPYWEDRHPDHNAASRVLDLAAFRSGLRRYATGTEAWRPDWICYYFINNATTPSFVVDVSAHYDVKRRALDCHVSQFTPSGGSAVATRLTATSFRRLIESRDTQFGAQIGVEYAEGIVVRELVTRTSLFRGRPVKIGIVCYASIGGSGVVATELAHALADRGHDVHLISADLPFRWRWATRGLSFERVEVPSYPLFREPQYLLALTNTIVQVSRRHRLDILHAHYAVPHATAAYLAHNILAADAAAAPRTVTTLHGTDITLVGSDASYADVVAFSIEGSHGITAVSESLKRDTASALGIRREIRVIPNFLDGEVWNRRPDPALRARLCASGACEAVVVHVSNFRPVKRVGLVLDIFRRIQARVRARLVMIGDGPDRVGAERQAAEYGLSDVVDFVGEQQELVPWLSSADLFLLPSSQESFGLAALEAMSCGVPVVASRVGGLPEVIVDGVTGFVCDPDDIEGMAERGIGLLVDRDRRMAVGDAAARDVRDRFSVHTIVPQYEAFYEEVLAGPAVAAADGARAQ